MPGAVLLDGFSGSAIDSRLQWHCTPRRWHVADSQLVVEPDGQTDFWQRTHYGFEADNGHFLYFEHAGDIEIATRVRFFPAHQYDQAGLMVRFSPRSWIKASVEYEPEGPSRLGAVVTSDGYSDWSTQDRPPGLDAVGLRIRREGDTFLVYCSSDEAPDRPPSRWTQIRMARLGNPGRGPLQCGIYACSPKGEGFKAAFAWLRATDRGWDHGTERP